tara:strand:+ start:55 stop:1146 length:1092 start_codon:yes stop_codon:yes gene_type:complete
MDSIKSEIIEKLKAIKYPGFNRDIISFGILKDIVIDKDNIVKILLNLNTNNQEHKDFIKNNVYELIKKEYDFKSIIVDFIEEVKPVNSANEKIKNIIAVGSCKGGVGKSTVALNLACELAKKYSVGLLDLDIYGPSLPTMIGSTNQPQFENDKLIPIDKYGIKFMSFGFINNENSPTIWRGPMVARMTKQFFDNVNWGELDYLIIDLPPGTGDIQLTLVQSISLSGAVIVTTPQDLSLVDVRKGSDMFNKVNVPLLGVIENMSNYLIEGTIKGINNFDNLSIKINEKMIESINKDGKFSISIDVFKGLGGESESKRLNVPLLGKLVIDSNLSISADKGLPYVLNYMDSPNVQEFSKIANAIAK